MNLQQLVAGMAAGMVSTATFYPLELIKTRMQVINGAEPSYRNVLASVRSVYNIQGIPGFYKGLTPGLLASGGSWGGYFLLYENSKSRKLANKPQGKLGVADHLLSGVEAGVAMVFLFNPLWLIKTRLSLQGALGAASKYNGLMDAAVQIYKSEGFMGYYKGLVPALILTSHGAIQFAVYEEFKSVSKRLDIGYDSAGNQSALSSAVGGGVSKIVAFMITYPYQVVKSRLQQGQALQSVNQPGTTVELYSGFIDCVKKVWRNEGVTAFFRGIFPGTVKVIPAASLTFVVYEKCLQFIRT